MRMSLIISGILLGVLAFVLLMATIPKTIMWVLFGVLMVAILIALVAKIGGRNSSRRPGSSTTWWDGFVEDKLVVHRAEFIYGTLGVLVVLINLIIHAPYREGWGMVLGFLCKEIALGWACVMALTLLGLIGSPRTWPVRRIIAGFVISAIVFNILSWVWGTLGVTVPNWGLRPLHTYGNEYQKFWAFVALVMIIGLIALQWTSGGRRGIGLTLRALGALILAGVFVIILFVGVMVGTALLGPSKARAATTQVTVPKPDPTETYSVPLEITSTDYHPVTWREVRAGFHFRKWDIQPEDEIGLKQQNTQPKEGTPPDLVLRGSTLGPVDDSWQTKPNGEVCIRSSQTTIWVKSMKRSRTTVGAVYSPQ